MTKEAVVSTPTVLNDKRVCQYCRHQENNPSRCHLRQYYVGRKDTCSNFGIKR